MKKLWTLLALTISFSINAQTGNTSTGTGSMASLTSGGDYNVAHGLESLPSNTTGDRNTAYGTYSMYTNVSGERNTASGYQSLFLNVSGERNTAIGTYTLYTNTGSRNTALGYQSLYYNTGDYNSAGGYQSLFRNISGDYNAAFGYESLYSNTSGNYNSAIGKSALYSNTTGEFNVAIGNRAGYSLTTGSNNSVFGSYAYVGSSSGSNRTVIGYDTSGQADNSVTLGNSDVTAIYMGEDSGATIYATGLRTASNAVLTLSGDDATFADDLTVSGDVNVSSDVRLKSNIISLGSTLSKLLLIDGKSYTINKDGEEKIGVLAQEVQKVFPELVGTDDNNMLTVNYQGLVPVLINALKEQQVKMREQEQRLSRLENIISNME